MTCNFDGTSKDDVFGGNSNLGELLHLDLILAAEFGAKLGQGAQDHGAGVATSIWKKMLKLEKTQKYSKYAQEINFHS